MSQFTGPHKTSSKREQIPTPGWLVLIDLEKSCPKSWKSQKKCVKSWTSQKSEVLGKITIVLSPTNSHLTLQRRRTWTRLAWGLHDFPVVQLDWDTRGITAQKGVSWAKKGRNCETPNFLVQKMNFNYRQLYFPWKLFWKWVKFWAILYPKELDQGAPSWWKIGVENVGNSILWRRKEPNWHGLLTETLWQIRKLIFVGEMLPRGQNALRRSTVLPVTKCRKHWTIRKSKTGEQFWFSVWTWCIFHFALFSYLVIFWWTWPIQQFLRVFWASLEKDIGASSSQPHLGCLHCSQSSPSKQHPSLFVFVHGDDLPSLQ